MDTVVLASDISFWDVVWWMLIVFVWTMVLWTFIATFGDIFSRRDLSGLAKAGWVLLIFVLPLLGILIYLITRPSQTPSEVALQQQMSQVAGSSSADEIAKAQALLQSGAISQEEFDQLKQRSLS